MNNIIKLAEIASKIEKYIKQKGTFGIDFGNVKLDRGAILERGLENTILLKNKDRARLAGLFEEDRLKIVIYDGIPYTTLFKGECRRFCCLPILIASPYGIRGRIGSKIVNPEEVYSKISEKITALEEAAK